MRTIFILFGCLFLITACQPAVAAQTPAPILSPSATVPPTAVPATATPAPTFTPAPSVTPFPQFFTNEFDSSLEGWVILQAGNESTPNIRNENSRLFLEMDAPYTWVYALYGAQDYDNVRVDTKFVNNAMSPASIGLICNYSETDGWLEYNVTTDGTYNVLFGKWLSNGVADYLPVLDGSTPEIAQSGVEQQIGLGCSNGILALYVNDHLIRNVDVSHYERANGKVGISAASYENVPVIASFDWVKVSTP